MSGRDFKHLLTHRAIVRKLSRDYAGNEAVLSTDTSVPCFCEYGKEKVLSAEGVEVVTKACIFFANDAPIDPEHGHYEVEQTFPYSREGMKVEKVDPIDDPRTGLTHHFEVWVR